jgi:hypothetical protein
MVIAVASAVATAGPVLPRASVTEAALRRGCKVPSEQSLTSTFTAFDAVAAAGAKTHPVAVPAFSKSAATMFEVGSLKVAAKVIAATFVLAVVAEVRVTVGPVLSTVRLAATRLAVGDAVPTRSVTEPEANVRTTVPELQPETVTTTAVSAAGLAVAGAKTQPVAVPAFVKSLAARPLTASLKVRL